jgi:hypothetical protein
MELYDGQIESLNDATRLLTCVEVDGLLWN